jgi:hypothetical protein
MSNLVGVRAAMKMIQPFDLSERVYGVVEYFSIDGHWEIESITNVRKKVFEKKNLLLSKGLLLC